MSLVACGSKSKNDNTGTSSGGQPTLAGSGGGQQGTNQLSGSYKSACANGSLSEVIVDGNTVREINHEFASLDCQGAEQIRSASAFSFTIGGAVSDAEKDVLKLNLVWQAASATPLTKDMTDQLNQSKACEVASWQIGVESNYLGSACTQHRGAGDTLYSRIQINGDHFVLGIGDQNHDGTSEAARYNFLDTETVYKRQ